MITAVYYTTVIKIEQTIMYFTLNATGLLHYARNDVGGGFPYVIARNVVTGWGLLFSEYFDVGLGYRRVSVSAGF
jgi:hypothetical protein